MRRSVAERFVAARLSALPLGAYPGPLPQSLADAYGRQDAAIDIWPDEVAGWKVGGIGAQWADRFGESRLVGPVFRHRIWRAATSAIIALPIIPGGFAAVEAEYVFVLAHAAPAGRLHWTPEEAAELVGELRVGIELAGSPLAAINELGPAVVVSDFGNHAGLVLGEPITGWRCQPIELLTCKTELDGRCVGRGGAASVSGGPLAALAFALSRCARRGRPLQAGEVISTGACTGIHPVEVGAQVRVSFAAAADIRCEVIAAAPAAADRSLPG